MVVELDGDGEGVGARLVQAGNYPEDAGTRYFGNPSSAFCRGETWARERERERENSRVQEPFRLNFGDVEPAGLFLHQEIVPFGDLPELSLDGFPKFHRCRLVRIGAVVVGTAS